MSTNKNDKYIKLLNERFSEFLKEDYMDVEDKENYSILNKKLIMLSILLYDFTTYDLTMDIFLSKKMNEVLISILFKTTFEYIGESKVKYINFITMVNMPFLKDKLEWGSSIRSAWFDHGKHRIDFLDIEVESLTDFFTQMLFWLKIEYVIR